jgi:methionyl-tRNA formyltransferase
MKILYLGNDEYRNCLRYLIDNGHEIAAVYVNEVNSCSEFTMTLCAEHGITVLRHKPSKEELSIHYEDGVELFLSADYQYTIPLVSTQMLGVNIHPTLLPVGRGPTPLPFLLEAHDNFAGITLHRISPELDSGDIFLQQKLNVTQNDSLNSLKVKLCILAQDLLEQFLKNPQQYVDTAKPQGKGIYWSEPEASERTLNWSEQLSTIKTKLRRFGHFGIYTTIEEQPAIINCAELIEYKHNKPLGVVLYEDAFIVAVSVSTGFVVILKENICYMY